MNMQALLDKSTIYTEALKEQMDRSREKHASVAATAQTRTSNAKQKQRAGRPGRHASGSRKRVRLGSDEEEDGDEAPKRARVVPGDTKPTFEQPGLLTGAKLKDYQLEGVAWMVSLWENGISGILGKYWLPNFQSVHITNVPCSADEMGLGKVTFGWSRVLLNVLADSLVSLDHSDHRIYRSSTRASRGAFPCGVPPQRLAQLDR